VLEEHERTTSGEPEPAVRETYTAALGVLGGHRVMRELSHNVSVPRGQAVTVSAA
jgi:hypothetical protein